MSPLIKVFLVFFLIIVLLRKKVGLGATMMAATFVLGTFFGLNPLVTSQQLFLTLLDPSTMGLILSLVLIMILESIMRQTGMLRTMTDSIFELPWNPRLLIVSIPAIIGLLPSAGGARFSAPLVDQATRNRSFTPEKRVFINYWFRHMWEFSLPLYPGLLLSAHISGISLSAILMWQWPFSIVFAILGYWYVFHIGQAKDDPSDPACSKTNRVFANLLKIGSLTWPLWVTVMLVLLHVQIALSLTIVLLLLIIQKKYSLRSVWQTLLEPLTLRIVLLTWGTMAFKDVLEVSGAVEQVSSAFNNIGIHPIAALILLPLLIGILTGLVQACIGVSFPLVMALVEPSASYVMLAYVAGVSGVMLSPVHLCFILTVEYFKADFIKSYRPLFVPTLLIVLFSTVVFKIFAY
ncbi:DUF401 family protein [Desulfotomaculum sp. 1211_IL3151]|uniref:DUF401 family protein n=1 Tax=Desulfotomaculum sp. 1211_IL3151 TaxID=3084055 RepID=UPI002FDAEE62